MSASRRRFRTGWVLLAAVLVDCGCPRPPPVPGPSNGPLEDTPPADLAERVVIVEQPEDGAPVQGAWTTVSGWVEPSLVQDVWILGAPVEGYYLPTGHMGAASVQVTVRRDGRFFAPRVPVRDGATTLTIVPVGHGGNALPAVNRSVTGVDTASIPATLVVEPLQPQPGQTATFRAATADSTSITWQWDTDGDGVFDHEGTGATHTFERAGRFDITARTKVNGQWLSAYTALTVARLPDVTASTTNVVAPSRVFVIPRFATPPLPLDADGNLDATVAATRYVAVIDGDDVKVFDPALSLLATLTGLSRPAHVAGDPDGRLYVADTGHHRIVRFLPSGAIDTSFGVDGTFAGSLELPVMEPIGVTVGSARAQIILGAGRVLTCTARAEETDDRPLLQNWTTVECDAYPLADVQGYSALGLTVRPRFVVAPTFLFESRSDASLLVGGGRVVSMALGAFMVVPRPVEVVDVAIGRAAFRADAVEVDTGGRVHTYERGQRTGSYTLPYAVTSVGAGPNGQVYVAGAGHLEARAFEVLK